MNERLQSLRSPPDYAPASLALPVPLDRPTLALGSSGAPFALGVGDVAFVSQAADLDHFVRLHHVAPERVVHDLDPDDATMRLVERLGLPRVGLQHHHAHFASAHADALLAGRAIGVILDGRGGELLVGTCAATRRAAQLRAVPRSSDDDDDELDDLVASFAGTSSTGRLFEAVAAILEVGEGDAGTRLEELARDERTLVIYPTEIRRAGRSPDASPFARGSHRNLDDMLAVPPPPSTGDAPDALDTLPIVRGVVRDRARGVAVPTIARRFHNTLVELIARACIDIARREDTRDVVLSGGVFANALLADELPARLRAFGLVPHLQRRVPPSRAGLSFGQLAAIAAMDRGAS